MAPYIASNYGNPSSGHWASAACAAAVADARAKVAKLIAAHASEVVFTSGGTESNNWVLKGVAARAQRIRGIERPHFVISAVEHPSISNACRYLERLGARVTEVGVDRHGLVDPNDIKNAMTSSTVLVSVMHANNEVGTIQPIASIAALAHEAGALCHTDAAQSLGKIPVRVSDLGVDLLTIAGHKLYAPKGIGALYIRDGVELDTFMHGGGHESGRRAGTENVIFIVALGAAAALAEESPCTAQLQQMGDHLRGGLAATFGQRVVILGHPDACLPNTVNACFIGRIGADLLAAMPTVAASTGSACHAGTRELSSVLAAMGVSREVGLGAIRFSLGRFTRSEELDRVIELLNDVQ